MGELPQHRQTAVDKLEGVFASDGALNIPRPRPPAEWSAPPRHCQKPHASDVACLCQFAGSPPPDSERWRNRQCESALQALTLELESASETEWDAEFRLGARCPSPNLMSDSDLCNPGHG